MGVKKGVRCDVVCIKCDLHTGGSLEHENRLFDVVETFDISR